jgi:hypothetical protein
LRFALALGLCVLAGCQQLDLDASRGQPAKQGPGHTGPMSIDPEGPGPADAGAPPPTSEPEHPSTDDCDPIRFQARAIRETNCAPCHQAPAKEGNFYFVLDDDVLAKAVSSTGQRFIVPGSPDNSRLFKRVAAGEMPPRSRMQRPTPQEVALLRDWISTCMAPGNGPTPDAGSATSPDAGAAADPGDGCGKPGQACCGANACDDGACCVLGQCRANGQACGSDMGNAAMPDGLPGMCVDGTCRKGAQSCGGVGQACCGESGSCTAPRAGCAMGAVCQACGTAGQPCCQNGGAATCVSGLSCSFTGFGRPSMCEPCGADGQSCCGNGIAAQKMCNAGLTCRFVAGMGDHCGK